MLTLTYKSHDWSSWPMGLWSFDLWRLVTWGITCVMRPMEWGVDAVESSIWQCTVSIRAHTDPLEQQKPHCISFLFKFQPHSPPPTKTTQCVMATTSPWSVLPMATALYQFHGASTEAASVGRLPLGVWRHPPTSWRLLGKALVSPSNQPRLMTLASTCAMLSICSAVTQWPFDCWSSVSVLCSFMNELEAHHTCSPTND